MKSLAPLGRKLGKEPAGSLAGPEYEMIVSKATNNIRTRESFLPRIISIHDHIQVENNVNAKIKPSKNIASQTSK